MRETSEGVSASQEGKGESNGTEEGGKEGTEAP
jgi:hypothetical protein